MTLSRPPFRPAPRLACAALALAAAPASAQTASPNTPVLPARDSVAPPASPNTPQLAAPQPSRPVDAPLAPTVPPVQADAPLTNLPASTAPRRVAGPPAPPAAQPRRETNSILPAPSEQPLAIDVAGDPVLALARATADAGAFQSAVADALARNPSRDEAEAQLAQVAAQRREARMGLFPTIDLNVTGYRVIARDFRTELDNIVERSRPRQRTDATASLNQTLFDFGATIDRIGASGEQLRAAAANIDDASARIVLQTIAAWYDVYGFRVLTTLGRSYRAAQDERRRELQQRIAQGVNASADVSRLDSSVASIDQRVARFERDLANAEARFLQLTGRPAPDGLARAPLLGDLPETVTQARELASDSPAVVAADAQARASRREARAAHADTLPNISAGVIAGRYGVLEKERDYDVRGVVTLRQRLFGAGDARADQADARAGLADARAARIREESARDAAVALADLDAFNRQVEALRASYIASRVSRDTTEERFRVSRGTLFDAIDANDTYFSTAASYIESLAQRDAAHYIVLARTGRLLQALGIASAQRQANPK